MKLNRLTSFLMISLIIIAAMALPVQVRAQDSMEMSGVPATLLSSTDMDGTPDGVDADAWLNATAVATFEMGDSGTDAVTVIALGLVPDGLYTLWWVNGMSGDMADMTMGPVGGTPANEFTADEYGNGISITEVASDNDYETIVIAYHADGETHGEMPGEMGTQTFSHLMGYFPGPANLDNLGYAVELVASDGDGTPEGVDSTAWLDSGAVAYIGYPADDMMGSNTGEDSDSDDSEARSETLEVTVLAYGLVPDGLYTMWWVNGMGGDMADMTLGPVGGTPANEFTADESGVATIMVEVSTDNGYESLVITYHADGETHGEMPGEMGTQTFTHVMGQFPSLSMMGESMGSGQ